MALITEDEDKTARPNYEYRTYISPSGERYRLRHYMGISPREHEQTQIFIEENGLRLEGEVNAFSEQQAEDGDGDRRTPAE